MQGGMPGGGYQQPGGMPPPVPVRKSNNSGCLIWSLVGCGALVVVAMILGALGLKQADKGGFLKKTLENASIGQQCIPNLGTVDTALERYRQDHKGKYPSSLKALIPKYLTGDSELTCGSASDTRPMEYSPPTVNSEPDAVLVRVHTGDSSIANIQVQKGYVCLLKDGTVVTQTVINQTMRPGHSAGSSSSTSP